MGDLEPGSGPRSYWEAPKPMGGCTKASVMLLVGIGLLLPVVVVLILPVAFLMNMDPAFHGYVPAAPLSLARMG